MRLNRGLFQNDEWLDRAESNMARGRIIFLMIFVVPGRLAIEPQQVGVNGIRPHFSRLSDAIRNWPNLKEESKFKEGWSTKVGGCEVAFRSNKLMSRSSRIELVDVTRTDQILGDCDKLQLGFGLTMQSKESDLLALYPWMKVVGDYDREKVFSYVDDKQCSKLGTGRLFSMMIRFDAISGVIRSFSVENSRSSCADYRIP